MDPTQEAPPPYEPDAQAAHDERQRAAGAVGAAVHQGLVRWTVLAFVGSLAAFLLQHPDIALFLGVAALFALAHSWDVRDRARTGDPVTDRALEPGGVGSVLRLLVPLVVPFSGASVFAGLAVYSRSLPWSAAHIAAMQWCAAAAAVCVFAAFPPVAQMLARTFMRGVSPGHADRLAASVALLLLLIPVPFQLLAEELLEMLKSTSQPVADVGALIGQLIGEVVFALAAVGLWVTRDLRAVRQRLGLGGMGLRHLLIAAAGLAAVSGVNAGMEWIERTQFHALWLRDQDMVKLIAGEISVGAAIVLGISAGVGEELLVRGALQPRVGLVWASLLFAAAHVQYTWFGMLTVAMLGVTLGVVRKHANTTTAVIVHVLYDVLAALGSR